jgi:hypothetical protein
VNLDELTKNPIFPTRPYMLKGSKEFLVSVELDQYNTVKEILDKQRYMIFQIDPVKKSIIPLRMENLVCTEQPKRATKKW